jgi:hypothetical protein
VSAAANRGSRRLTAALLTAGAFLATAASATAANARARTTSARAITGSCAPKDVRSDRLVEHFKAFVGKTDMGGTVEKTTMGLAKVTPSQVALVTDKAICTKAAAVYDRQLDIIARKIGQQSVQKRSSYSLYVVTLGSSYAVEDTKSLQAGFETADIYDKDWKYIGVRQIHS